MSSSVDVPPGPPAPATGPSGDARGLPALVSSRWGKWVVVALWLAVLVVSVPLAGRLTGAQENDAASWLPGGAESTRVLEAQQGFADSDALPAVVVYERPDGVTPEDVERATADARAFGQLDRVAGEVVGPVPSEDGAALQTIVPLTGGGDEGWEAVADAVEEMRATLEGGPDGLESHVTGPGGVSADSAAAFAGIDGKLLYAALGVVVVLLLLTYRSPVLWLFPILAAGVALFVAQAVIYLLATRADLTVNGQSAGILTVLVIGAGTDYALLLVARYREELRRHADRHEAMAVALRRAGPAIVASAATVVVGMLCLTVADLNSTRGLGPVAAIGVAVALVAMVTLLPALLVVVGRWVFWPVRPKLGTPEPTESGLWARTGAAIGRRPRVTWVTTTVVLAAMSLGLLTLQTGVLSNRDSFTNVPDSVVGEEVLARHFPGGAGSPVVVVSGAGSAAEVREAVVATPGIASAVEPATAGGTAYLEATLADPPDSQAARDTIDRVRESVRAVPGADALVGGGTAIALDVDRASERDRNVIIPLVLAAVFVILAVLLRALVAPLVLIATVVLSFAAALGVSALVFQYLLGFERADTSFPLFVFVFLVALGIDYNIFLMTRVREETVRLGPWRGPLVGLSATGAVITSAGLVLAGTFAVLGTLPVVAFAQIGFAVAFGVLLDTIIVRAVLVTALGLDLGRHMWWPSALAKRGASEVPGPGEPDRRPVDVGVAQS